MFDFLAYQLLTIAETRRQGLSADLLAESRPRPEPLPLGPNQPAATRFQVTDVLRRLRENRRKASNLLERVSPEPPEAHPVGHIIDRWV